MDCIGCRDRLPDFLLEELSASEAVLVQEHLALCKTCQQAYNELKGTGRGLEAIAAVQPMRASPEFGAQVMREARRESEKLIETLPPEVRLRAQRRRAARLRAEAAAARPKPAAWSGVAALMLAALGVAALVLFYPRAGAGPVTVGRLSIAVGTLQQFYQKSKEPWSAAAVDQPVRSGDEFATGADGRARFEAASGGAVLLGPDSEIRWLPLKDKRSGLAVELLKGELIAERPAPESAGEDLEWLLRCEQARVQAAPGAKVLISLAQPRPGAGCSVKVLAGRARVSASGSADSLELSAGEGALAVGDVLTPERPESQAGPRTPGWRADLLSEPELSAWLAGQPRILARGEDGLLVQLSYTAGARSALADWRADQAGAALSVAASGGLRVPPEAGFVLAAPLTVPLTFAATVNGQTPKDVLWTFAVLRRGEQQVLLELGAEAVLQINAAPIRRVARATYRSDPRAAERVQVELARQGPEHLATLSTSAGRTAPLPLPKALEAPGEACLKALGDGLILDELKLTGVLPRAWLRQRLEGR